jgi:hypothetical protein
VKDGGGAEGECERERAQLPWKSDLRVERFRVKSMSFKVLAQIPYLL